ncbi:MICOS complex subunit MIC10 [Bagarius yarrelli]|uniref:MICOS complex subunit MIC10 n=1 Tax=Bagarius yarrelli TaxID=175774 RepID=A0A556V190_BAGYA|nr:MICOS complex subunit MIC10 [Bagarius yarrelli]
MSEKELGQKWDRCLADCAVKVGRTMPIAFGTGAGLGMAYSNCQNDLRSPYLLHSNVRKVSISLKACNEKSLALCTCKQLAVGMKGCMQGFFLKALTLHFYHLYPKL